MLKGYDFRITRVDAKGRPTHFELAVGNEDSDCTLWASPSFMNEKLPAHLSERYKKRIEDSIEGPDLATESRTYDVLMNPTNHTVLRDKLATEKKP